MIAPFGNTGAVDCANAAFGSAAAGWTAQEDERAEQDVLNVMDLVAKEYNVDLSRVYLHGQNPSGSGALYLAQKYPERFAAEKVAEARLMVMGACLGGTPLLGFGHRPANPQHEQRGQHADQKEITRRGGGQDAMGENGGQDANVDAGLKDGSNPRPPLARPSSTWGPPRLCTATRRDRRCSAADPR